MALLGEVCLAAVNVCPLHWRPQRNGNIFASFWSVQLRWVHRGWPNTLRTSLCIMHGPLMPRTFENTWKVSSWHTNFHSLWRITKGKQFLVVAQDFQSWGNLELLQLILKLWCCHHASLNRGFAKGRKKIQYQVPVTLQQRQSTRMSGQEFSISVWKSHLTWNSVHRTELKQGRGNLGFQFGLISDR